MTVMETSPELQQKLGDELAKATTVTLSSIRNGAADLGKVRALRLELARLCLELPEASIQRASGLLLELRTAVRSAGFLETPRTSSEEEVVNRARTRLRSGRFGDPGTSAAVAGMLLADAYELPLLTDFECCPPWLLGGYLDFLFDDPTLFQRIGDASHYREYLQELVGRIWAGLEHAQISPISKQVLACFVAKQSFLQAYFRDGNIRELFTCRARLLETALEWNGYPLAHMFRPRTTVPTRLKLGILTQVFAGSTETFHNLCYFEHLDRNAFELTLYVIGQTGHALEEYCRTRSDRFVVLPESDLGAQVSRIRSDDLDVILIASNITAATKQTTLIAAHRLARLQVGLMDSPVTTGFRNIDVMLSSEWNEPRTGGQEQYTERLRYLDGPLNCYAYEHDREPATISITRADLKCDSGSVLYFSGANYYKILPELVETWAKILAAVPESTLVLMPFNPHWSRSYPQQSFINRIKAQLAEHGVSAERLRVVGCVPTRADVHNVIRVCDVYLDPYPFAGACSLVDPLLVGLPVVAWQGETTRTRHAQAILGPLGLGSLVAETEEEYIRKAVEFGRQPILREQTSREIAGAMQNNPPVLDTVSFGGRVGRALTAEFEQYVQHLREMLCEDTDAAAYSAGMGLQISQKNARMNEFADTQITEHIIQPYLRGMLDGKPGHIVDVGACYGQISLTFLRDGWTADLFEPDAGAREVLNRQLTPFAAQCRVHPFAVSDAAKAKVRFYRASQHGLSGLNPTIYGRVDKVSTVRCVRLGPFLREQSVRKIDFLKVDAEGWDFEVLAGHDFEHLRPTIIFIEYGAERQRPHVVRVLDRMRLRGYSALLFNYTDDGNFRKGIWESRLISVVAGDRARELPADAFGNILFYPTEERLFPAAVADFFSSLRR